MPTVLRELMRHASINTTMAYYVGTNAEATADAIWAAAGTKLGTIGQLADNNCDMQKSKNTSHRSES